MSVVGGADVRGREAFARRAWAEARALLADTAVDAEDLDGMHAIPAGLERDLRSAEEPSL